MEWIKQHKIASFLIIGVGGFLFFMIIRSGGSSASSGTSSTSTASQQLQAAITQHQQDNSAQLAAASIAAQSQKDIATLAADVANTKIASQQTVDLATLDSTEKLGALQLSAIKAGLDAQSHAADLGYYATTNAQNISYNEAQIQADTARQQAQLNYSLDFNTLSANTGLQNKQLDIINGLVSNVSNNNQQQAA